MAYGVLPGIRVTWPAYAEGDTFVSYNVYRRPLRTILDEHETAEVSVEAGHLIPNADLYDGFQFAVAVRFSLPWDNSSEPEGGAGTPMILSYYESSDDRAELYYDEATNSLKFLRVVGGASQTVTVAKSVTADASITAIIYQTPTTIGLSVDGAAFQTAARASAAIEYDYLEVGSSLAVHPSSQTTSWLAAFRGTLTDADAAIIDAWADDEWGDYPPSLESLRELTTTTAIPTGLWINEGDTAQKVVPADWTLVATIDDVAQLNYSDRRVFSRQLYEYAVTVSVTIFDEPFESDKQSPPSADSVTFEQVAIHNVRDETDYGRFACNAMELVPQLEYGDVLARGRTKVVRQYGERDDSHIKLTPVTHLYTDRQDWDALRKFLSKQREAGAIFQVRPGHVPEGWFAQFDLSRTDDPMTYNAAIDGQEVYVDEDGLA